MSGQPSDLQSPLAAPIRAFLTHHRALGKRFDTEASALRLLDHYLMEQGVDSLDAITPAVLDAFLRSRPRSRPRSYNHLLNVLQRLFRWLETQETLVPSPLHAEPRRCTSQRTPFLFEPGQIERLLELAAQLPDRPNAHHRGATYRMIFALMYAVGLRVSEVPDRPGALPPHRTVTSPQALLRTAHASFPASGSSISKAPIKGPVVSRLSLA